jgi:hypothetical protein
LNRQSDFYQNLLQTNTSLTTGENFLQLMNIETQQLTLAGSALRTWRVYQTAQNQVVGDVQAGNIDAAQNLLHVQAEPTNADAQSALRALISFDERLASYVVTQPA